MKKQKRYAKLLSSVLNKKAIQKFCGAAYWYI